MHKRLLYDLVALLLRLGTGVVFMAHGWQKIQVGVTATASEFSALGVPAPTATAIYATFTELLGGAALVIGIGLPFAGLLLFLEMAGTFLLIHTGGGLGLVDRGRVSGGRELVLVLGLVALFMAVGGAGRFTLDRRLSGRDRGDQGHAEGDDDSATGASTGPATPTTTGSTRVNAKGGTKGTTRGAAAAKTGASAPGGNGADIADRADRAPGSASRAPASAGRKPAAGAKSTKRAAKPRLTAEIAGDSADGDHLDVLVTDRKGRAVPRPSASGTGPAGTSPPKDAGAHDSP